LFCCNFFFFLSFKLFTSFNKSSFTYTLIMLNFNQFILC
jgi:hypothetical protein